MGRSWPVDLVFFCVCVSLALSLSLSHLMLKIECAGPVVQHLFEVIYTYLAKIET